MGAANGGRGHKIVPFSWRAKLFGFVFVGKGGTVLSTTGSPVIGLKQLGGPNIPALRVPKPPGA